MIEIKNISKSFGNNKVIDDVSFVLQQGKTNLVIGESGSGKTTTLKMMVGLHTVDSGQIIYDKVVFNELNEKQKQDFRKDIGMLFQGGALFDSMTVEENIGFALKMFTQLSDKEITDRVNFCLEKVRLHDRNNLYPAELSGGMKKRAALARAIVSNPKYLFCDEPNSGLDPKTSIIIDELIHELTVEFNMTTVIITHDMNSVMQIGENVVFLYQGKKWWEGNNQTILDTNNKELLDFVYAANFLKKTNPNKNLK
ncbi:MAG TPA: ATP-binding cassette domain-containing protein [Bacteroidia bacterium]|nr:ATP-binding cassette domain-containing protein [Bacteroidia bacterium]